MRVSRSPLFLVALLSLATIACDPDPISEPGIDAGIVTDGGVVEDGGQPDGSIPEGFAVVSFAPASGASGVATNTSVAVTFSHALDQASITADTLLVFPASSGAPAKVTGSFSFPADGRTVVFKPQAALAGNTQYKVLIKGGASGVLAADGSKLDIDVEGSFTTAAVADTTAPTVKSTVPADGAKDVFLDQKITVRFSEPVDPTSLEASAFELIETWEGVSYGAPFAGTWDFSNNPTVVFDPSTNFEALDEYTLTLKAGGVKDLAGNALAADYVTMFDCGTSTMADAPTVVSTSPADEATGVPTNSALKVTFSERMRQSTVVSPTNVQLFPSADSNSLVTLQRNYSNNPTFLFYPQTNLAPNTRYTLKFVGGAGGVQDEGQTPMLSSYSIHFTTGAGPDTSPLQVTDITPAPGATNISQVVVVEVTFDRPVDPASVKLDSPNTDATFRVTRSADGLFPEAGTLDSSENPKIKFAIAATTTYELEHTYHVRITGGAQGVKSLTGATMAADYTSTFTVKGPDQDNATIADLRAANGVCAIRVRGVYATFFRDSSNDWSGFFAQKDGTGPGIYVVTGDKDYPPFGAIYPDTRADGYPNIDLTVTKVQEFEGFKQVVAWSWTRNDDAMVDLPWLKANLVQVIGDEPITENHEAEYVQIDGTLANYRPGTTQNRLFDLTWGTNRKVTLKVADGLKVGMGLQDGTRVRVMAPVSQDDSGYYVRPNVYTTEQPMSATDLDIPDNYEYLLDIVKLAP